MAGYGNQRTNLLRQQAHSNQLSQHLSSRPTAGALPNIMNRPGNVSPATTAPPLPPRSSATYLNQPYLGQRSMFNSMDMGYNGGGGMYNSHPYSFTRYGSPGYSNGLGLYGRSPYSPLTSYGYNSPFSNINQQNPSAHLSQAAFESSRPAFDAILSVIHAFGSVSTMLESMFDAVYSSFNAVLGAADQFGHMKTTFAEIYSTFALFRLLRFLYKRLTIFLKLRKEEDFAEEFSWKEAQKAASNTSSPASNKSNWPVLIFLSIAIGGPYVVYKILSHFLHSPVKAETSDWRKDVNSIMARANYNFKARQVDELSFNAGDILVLQPKATENSSGWIQAMRYIDGKKGIVPANYLVSLGRNNDSIKQLINKQRLVKAHESGNQPEQQVGELNNPGRGDVDRNESTSNENNIRELKVGDDNNLESSQDHENDIS